MHSREIFHTYLVTLSLLVLARCRRVFKGTCGSEATFYRIANDHILDEEPIAKNVTSDLVECIDLCVSVEKCVAMNTHKRNDSKVDCHLLKDDHMSKPRKMIAKKGWNFYDTGSKEISRTIGSRCTSFLSNPCPSHCTCVDTCEGYECQCYGPEIFSSCREALSKSLGSDIFHWIRLEGMKSAVYVKCEKGNDGSFRAFVDHNLEERNYVSGYTVPASFYRQLDYKLNKLEDVIEFVNASASCRQHTKLECYGMKLFNGDWGYLNDRNGQKLTYFGGGPSNGTGCACGTTGTCSDNTYKCNCDANLATLLSDSGHITDKGVLPLTRIHLSNSLSGGYGYFSIGKLECIEPFPSCREALQEYPNSGHFHWIKYPHSTKAVYVKCQKDSDGNIWANFDHDAETRTFVTGYETAYSYKKSINYAYNDMNSIKAFIDASSTCKQYTRYECVNTAFISLNNGALIGRDGKKLAYFGGGPASDVGCNCGFTGTCVNPKLKCNCDSNSATSTEDKGFVTKRADLPITAIWLGDSGTSSLEYGYHTIGKLQCRDTFTSCYNALRIFPEREYFWILRSPMTEAVHVKCVKKSDGTEWTEIDVKTGANDLITGVANCHGFQKQIDYGVNKAATIASFIDKAASCKQYTKLSCQDSKFLSHSCGHLKGRDKRNLLYFGGGPFNGFGCACGYNMSCLNSARRCNCDAGIKDTVVYDQGYVEAKGDLPLTEISLGGVGSAGQFIEYDIGKIECTDVFSSCTEALLMFPSEVNFFIKPETSSAPVRVQCKVIDSVVWAIFKHDNEAKKYVKGYNTALSYKQNLRYYNGMPSIIGFVNSSFQCKQHVRVDCHGTSIIYGGNQYLALFDRKGQRLDHFPGGAEGTFGCSCGKTGTCVSRDKKCNCDINTEVLNHDEGYETNKQLLPLTAIAMGDTDGSNEYAYHTIGSLQCSETFPSCAKAFEAFPSVTKQYFSIRKGSMSSPVFVECEKKSDGTVWAYFSHDSEFKKYISGYETCLSYEHALVYKLNKIADIVGFVSASASCRQFTRVDCRGTTFVNGLGTICGRLLGRDGKALRYFGGGPHDGSGCACGITNSCLASTKKCNCDANSDTLTFDEGYVTFKDDLPITKIQWGDTGASSEYAFHTIGKLECQEASA
ncbi:uncharacterized protein LOC135682899 isoform X3 [Rhopilema esculentum]|uniref:uncharacterized protein LOC135682899 isoform X3 n=1 Tax=Rhopilema esculentum TaxID=499914 RepID=UPI0031DC8F56